MLIKFCKPEHNLSTGCNTIRLGTLEYYRDLDPSFLIADSEEGVDTHEVNHSGSIPSDSECIAFLNSSGFYSPDPDFFIQGINFRRTFPNCYIWCCRTEESDPTQEDGRQFDESYTSHYRIPDPNEFIQSLANLLMKNIKRENFTDIGHGILDSIPISDFSNIQLMCFHGPVLYVQKKEGRLDFGRFQSYAKEIPFELRPLFVKNSKYSDDKEYRFVFVFHNKRGGQVLPVKPEPVDIRSLPVI